MKRQDCTIRHLLLSYVSLLAERESYGPGDGFEYVLWDDLMRPVPELVSRGGAGGAGEPGDHERSLGQL
jgi:hypothetical protein